MAQKFWLVKTEPTTYSIDDFARDKRTLWEGVRNYQARNFMKEMCVGDNVLIYHSSCEPPGVVGLAKVSKLAMPDPTAFEKKSEYFDPKATHDHPIWECVQLEFVSKFESMIPLEMIRKNPKLANMNLLQKGSRLSVQPVSESEFKTICGLG